MEASKLIREYEQREGVRRTSIIAMGLHSPREGAWERLGKEELDGFIVKPLQRVQMVNAVHDCITNREHVKKATKL